ncbi:MAG: hypothetical protein Unbinned5607contig1000_20 [Prokaryotic dsDNA virus sp.]|nr:MAG: hypothetical protein Unbinned5607contig1000_20 [Prokaryotic dsDNA virus sp.]
MSWCFKNDIKVMVMPTRQGKNPPVKLEIHLKGKIIKGKHIYKQDEDLSLKIYEIYKHYYTEFS